MNEFLQSFSSLPNLHPALVHFPVAVLAVAFGFDLACLLLRRQIWLDRSAAALYAIGALAAVATYLSGRQAADSVGSVPPAAEILMAEHSDWAFFTVLFFLALATLRIGVAWRDWSRSAIRVHPVRILLLLTAMVGQWLIFQTADRGGAMVFAHGVGVNLANRERIFPSGSGVTGLPGNGIGASDLVIGKDGSLAWIPTPGNPTPLDSVFDRFDGQFPEIVATSNSTRSGSGIALSVSGRSFIVLAGLFDNLRMEAKIDLSDFSGTVGLAHHAIDPTHADIFEVSTDGSASLVQFNDDGRNVLAEGDFRPPEGPMILAISSVGTHLKGMSADSVLEHGHRASPPPGKAGLLLNGEGILRIFFVRVTPLASPS